METAVLYCVFNRLDVVKRTFEPIRQAKPKRFYIACDGARDEKVGETEIVEEIRKYILDNIDWDCEVKTLFRDTNLGCNGAICGALDWLFANEEMGIIIEDDILASPQFFEFCEKMLLKYKDNIEVRGISGYGYKPTVEGYVDKQGLKKEQTDYYFSPSLITWGWATWRRSYENFFPTSEDKKKFSNLKILKDLLKTEILARHYLLGCKCGEYYNSWDVDANSKSLLLAKDGCYSIISRPTLVSNIGDVGTHYTEANEYINRPIDDFDVAKMVEPKDVKVDYDFLGWKSIVGLIDTYSKIYGKEKIDYLKIEKDLFCLRLKQYTRFLKMITSPAKKRSKREWKYLNAENDVWMIEEFKRLMKSK